MPRDASGTYTLPTAPFQPLTLAKSAEVNTALDDIADALTDSQSRTTPTPAQGDLNLNGHNILNLGEVVGDLNASGTIIGGGIQAGLNGASNPALLVNGASGTERQVACQTNGVTRWTAAANSAAESGNNAGSDYAVNRFSDAGTYLGTPLTISRATGAVSVTQTLGVSGTLTVAQGLNANGGIATTNIGASGNVSVGGTITASSTITAPAAQINGNINAATANISGTITATGTITAPAAQINGNVTASGIAQGRAMQAFGATGNGGFVGSYQGNASSNLGFINISNVLYWGAGDGNSAWAGPVRMSLGADNHLLVNGHISAQDSIYATNEVHAGNRGIYYTGIDSDAHAVAFAWASTQMNVYVDKSYVGHILMGALARQEGAPAIDEVVAGLEARIAALEAKVAGG